MSGGSLNYAYARLDEAVEEIRSRGEEGLHLEFAAHLDLVVKALHDLEWVWSCDYGLGDETKAILAVLRKEEKEEMSESKEKETARLEVHDVYQLRGQAAGVLARLESAFTMLAQQGDQKGARVACVAAEREAEILCDRLGDILKANRG